MYFISQVSQHDCAFACLKMMLANYHHDKNYLFLPGKDGAYSYKELKDIAAKYHMNAIGIRIKSVQELFGSKEFPFMITLDKGKGIKHSVLLLSVNRKYAKVFDPETGKRRIKMDDLYQQWDLKALIVEKEKDYIREECDFKPIDFISKKDKITLPIWQLASGISLLLAVYFINSNSYFFVPIILFALFFIFEIIFRKGLINALKRMDDNIFNYKIKASQNEFYDFYKVEERYRFIALSIIPNFIFAVLVSVFMTVLLIINDSMNAIYVILALVLAIIHVYIYLPYHKRKSNELLEEESKIKDVQNQFQFRAVVSNTHDAAYQLGLFKNAFTYIEIAILLMSAITIMSLSHVVSVIYVVFYLCISVYLKDNFVRLLECSTQSEDFDNQLVKLLHYIDLDVSNNSIV